MSKQTVVITGCAGFIGSHVVDEFLGTGYKVIGYDAFTYAGKESNLVKAKTHGDMFVLVKGSINDVALLTETVKKYDAKWIINLAAETHVDNSIKSSDVFLHTNILGTKAVLDVCRDTGCILLHFSTDEVYGVSTIGIPFIEKNALDPQNPYSATKAAADHLIATYRNTYGTKHIIVRPSNNFGTRQHSEKFLPTILRSIGAGKRIPVYGDGKQIREWTNVCETAKAVRFVFENSPLNEVYNITSGMYLKNIDVIRIVCTMLGLDMEQTVEYVEDRKGHDFRYSISSNKLAKLGYYISSNFSDDLKEVIDNDFSGLWNKTRMDKTKDTHSKAS